MTHKKNIIIILPVGPIIGDILCLIWGEVGKGDHGVIGHLVLYPHVGEGGQRVREFCVPGVQIKGRVLIS